MVYWVWLQKIIGFGSSFLPNVIERFGSAKGLYEADVDTIRKSGVLPPSVINKIGAISLSDCYATINVCKHLGIDIVTPDMKSYPKTLLCIDAPPAVLYVKGRMPDFELTPTFCIVGPRNCTEFGKKSAYSLAYRLALGGMTIVSGGAVGADFYAHAGALNAGGVTVLVMPCGIDVEYPVANKEIRKAVIQKGCVISEFPPGYNVTKGAFRIRNRIMSGLALGVAVVEASEKSGALITANCAAEQGKDVFVVPGRAKISQQYAGSDKLLKDGAIPLLSAVNIFECYYPMFSDKIDMRRAYNINKETMNKDYQQCSNKFFVRLKKVKLFKPKTEKAEKRNLPKIDVLSSTAKLVYSCFNDKEISVDDICIEHISDADVFAALSELELYGFIQAMPGGRFEKKN